MTNIEWTHAPGRTGCTWNPVIGCRHVAEGCRHCYAETMSKRLAAMGQKDYASILDAKGKFNGKAITRPATLAEPLRWKKPRMVFVNSMSDLFHEDVPFEFIAAVFGVMAACPQHTFQVLTKRPERALAFFQWVRPHVGVRRPEFYEQVAKAQHPAGSNLWPLKNVWLGVSIATQADADKNIPVLLKCPAAVRFVSAEPLIEAVNIPGFDPGSSYCPMCGAIVPDTLSEMHRHDGVDLAAPYDHTKHCASVYDLIHWVIVGGESGPGARPCDVAWIRSIVQQCKSAGVPVFVKQLGAAPEIDYYCEDDHLREWAVNLGGDEHVDYSFQPDVTERLRPKLKDKKGGDPAEWPEDLRVRQFPEVAHV